MNSLKAVAGLAVSFPVSLSLVVCTACWLAVWALLGLLAGNHGSAGAILGWVLLPAVGYGTYRFGFGGDDENPTVRSIVIDFGVVIAVGVASASWIYFPDVASLEGLVGGSSPAVRRFLGQLMFGALGTLVFAVRRLNAGVVSALVKVNEGTRSIAFFRSYRLGWSLVERRRLIPALGAHGTLKILVDDALALYPSRPLLGYADELVFNPSRVVRTTDENWQERALHLLDGADTVVVDITDLTGNVLWELENTLQRKPLGSILFICNADGDAQAQGSLLRGRFPEHLVATSDAAGSLMAPLRYAGYAVVFRWRLFLWALRNRG